MTDASDVSQTGPWEPVQETWTTPATTTAEVPGRRHPSTMPPQLPSSKVHQIDAMLAMLARSDYEGARIAAKSVLRADATDADAKQCADIAASELRKLYLARIGSLTRVPRPVRVREGTSAPFLDKRGRTMMGAMDGVATVEQLVQAGLLEPLDALRAVSELVLEGLVVLGDRQSTP